MAGVRWLIQLDPSPQLVHPGRDHPPENPDLELKIRPKGVSQECAIPHIGFSTCVGIDPISPLRSACCVLQRVAAVDSPVRSWLWLNCRFIGGCDRYRHGRLPIGYFLLLCGLSMMCCFVGL